MSAGIGAFFAVALLAFLRWSVRRSVPQNEGGVRVLRYHWLVSVLGVLGIVLLPALYCFALFTTTDTLNPRQAWGAAAVVGLVAAIGSWIAVVALRTEYRWSERELIWARANNTERRLQWDDVVGVSFTKDGSSFVIRGTDGTKISVSIFVRGLPVLIEFLSARMRDKFDEQATIAAKDYGGR